MDIGIGTCFSTKKYEYTITERDNLGFFIASVKFVGSWENRHRGDRSHSDGKRIVGHRHERFDALRCLV